MSPGWNLGNSFDATPNETSWGNPTPNQTLIKAVHAAGFKTLRIPGDLDESHRRGAGVHDRFGLDGQGDADGAVGGRRRHVRLREHAPRRRRQVDHVPRVRPAAATVAAEVKAVWTQIATAFKSFDSHLMLECFNEPHEAGGGNDAATQTDLNMYLEACVNAIRGTGGANATRLIMIQPVGASPLQDGIQSMLNATIIGDPNLLISIHTYYPTNFGLSETRYAWGSADDYTSMQNSIAQEIRVWLPTQPIVIGEWGSMGAQAMANRVAHALAYSQDVTTAGMVPLWWDNGGSGSGSFGLFNRTTGASDADDRQRHHDRRDERSGGAQQLGDAPLSHRGGRRSLFSGRFPMAPGDCRTWPSSGTRPILALVVSWCCRFGRTVAVRTASAPR